MKGRRSYEHNNIGSYDMKVVDRDHVALYSSFGWARTKEAVPYYMNPKTRSKLVLMKRHPSFGNNSYLVEDEAEFDKLFRKNYKNQKRKSRFASFFTGVGVLLIILLFVSGIFELVYGIIKGKNNLADLFKDLEFIHKPIFAGIDAFVEQMINGKINLDSAIIVALVAFLVAIILTIIIPCSKKRARKKRKERDDMMSIYIQKAQSMVAEMRYTDATLMSKSQRKEQKLESIVTRAMMRARPIVQPAPVVFQKNDRDDDDFDDDF